MSSTGDAKTGCEGGDSVVGAGASVRVHAGAVGWGPGACARHARTVKIVPKMIAAREMADATITRWAGRSRRRARIDRRNERPRPDAGAARAEATSPTTTGDPPSSLVPEAMLGLATSDWDDIKTSCNRSAESELSPRRPSFSPDYPR